jgi:HK97 family phage prohead protease
MLYKYSNFDLRIKDVDEIKGIVSGYFAAFNVKDSAGDVIKKGAFQKSIMERGPNSSAPRIKHFMNHDKNHVVGKLLELFEDEKGLGYASQVGTHTDGRDFIEMVKSDLITEHSVGFQPLQENNDRVSGANFISEGRLWEGSSLTGWGVNQFTPLTGLKELDFDMIQKHIDNIDAFCRTSNATDATIELLEKEAQELLQLMKFKITHAESEKEKSHEPNNSEAALAFQLQTLNTKLKWTLKQ